MEHVSVMLNEAIEFLNLKPDGVYVDCTFGGGGYSREILGRCSCKLVGIDRDPFVIPISVSLNEKFGDRFSFFNGTYSLIDEAIEQAGFKKVDGIVLDLGVSSFQIDDPDRGFSFKNDGPLDMRMGQQGVTALDIIKRVSEAQLADIIYEYGEERKSRRIAKAIKSNLKSVRTTADLASIVRSVLPKDYRKDPATRTFQALRIYVNDELGELEKFFDKCLSILNFGARVVVVTFHSLEDRIVKTRFNEFCKDRKIANLIIKKPMSPSELEIKSNARARSAKLRVIEYTGGDSNDYSK